MGRERCRAENDVLRSFGPPRPNASDRRIEIIGASISNGLGDMGTTVGCQGWSQVCFMPVCQMRPRPPPRACQQDKWQWAALLSMPDTSPGCGSSSAMRCVRLADIGCSAGVRASGGQPLWRKLQSASLVWRRHPASRFASVFTPLSHACL